MSEIAVLDHVCVVGCGLIGGSFALALRRAGYRGRLTAFDAERTTDLAIERGIIDAREDCFEEGTTCQADLVFLAAPIGAIVGFLREHGPALRPATLVTDAGSTKSLICRTAAGALPAGVDFVGGHPMAGSEHRGVEYARADLFDRATWAIVPPAQKSEAARRLTAIVTAIGARPLLTEPDEHDRAVALVSHLPQLLSSSLATLLADTPDQEPPAVDLARNLAATGWRDMTRLAASSFTIWRDIVMTNPDNLSEALARLQHRLQLLQEALEHRDYQQVRQIFLEANTSVEQLRSLRYRPFDEV